jgi:hypothetical protein
MSKTVKSSLDTPYRKCFKERSYRSYRRMCKQDTRNAVDSPEDYSPLMYDSRSSFGNVRMRGRLSDSPDAGYSNN